MADQTGAVTHESTDSQPMIKRKKTPEEEVLRLQARIVKAQEEGHWNKVKVLQRMLAHSHNAKVLAVERVSENDGRKTPGIDKDT